MIVCQDPKQKQGGGFGAGSFIVVTASLAHCVFGWAKPGRKNKNRRRNHILLEEVGLVDVELFDDKKNVCIIWNKQNSRDGADIDFSLLAGST